MAKKKATMTLKDFHGGSIPSDLPLPSAPGVSVRPAGFDRLSSWGNPVGRSDPRLRPASAGSARAYDDKTPFLTHIPYIGRNFDEDERKPLDGVSGPRRTVSDDSIHNPPGHVPRKDYSSSIRPDSRPSSTPVPQFSAGGSYSGRFNESHNVRLNGGGFDYKNAGSVPNAWGVRKEAEPVSAAWSAPEAAAKLAHASALEKVSSGRWHSTQLVHPQKEVENFENGREFIGRDVGNRNNYNRLDLTSEVDGYDVALSRHAERNLVIDGGKEEMPSYVASRPVMYMERNPSFIAAGKSVSPVPSESSERPKLKLLPKSNPSEGLEPLVGPKKGGQQLSNSVHVEDGTEFQGSVVQNQVLERPKLNLKPRSQPIERLEGNTEIKRKTVFGEARPREVVLKERGIDDVIANNHANQPPPRINHDAQKTETVSMRPSPRHNEKPQSFPGDRRMVRSNDRRDQRTDTERTDAQRKSNNWRNNKEIHSQQQQERPPSPETWRKPVEFQKPASPDSSGLRFGKAASAVELAQAFSRPVSDQKVADRFSGLRSIPAHNQMSMPFSRLTGPSRRHQINGY